MVSNVLDGEAGHAQELALDFLPGFVEIPGLVLPSGNAEYNLLC